MSDIAGYLHKRTAGIKEPEMLPPKERAEKLTFIKERAIKELEHAGPPQALASILGDFNNFPGVINNTTKAIFELMAMQAATSHDPVNEMRRFIEGIN